MFVQACFDEGRQQFSPKLRRITTENVGFVPVHEAYLKKTSSLAVTMEGYGDYQKKFDIWVTPQYKTASPKFYMTLAHELTHGYAGLKYGHNSHWRRWFYRVLWHLNSAGYFNPESPIEDILFSVECAYNVSSLKGGIELLDEAVAKAGVEHHRVLENFAKRMIGAPSNH